MTKVWVKKSDVPKDIKEGDEYTKIYIFYRYGKEIFNRIICKDINSLNKILYKAFRKDDSEFYNFIKENKRFEALNHKQSRIQGFVHPQPDSMFEEIRNICWKRYGPYYNYSPYVILRYMGVDITSKNIVLNKNKEAESLKKRFKFVRDIKEMLEEIEMTRGEENKKEVATKIMDYIVENKEIFYRDFITQKFRNTVRDKMIELAKNEELVLATQFKILFDEELECFIKDKNTPNTQETQNAQETQDSKIKNFSSYIINKSNEIDDMESLELRKESIKNMFDYIIENKDLIQTNTFSKYKEILRKKMIEFMNEGFALSKEFKILFDEDIMLYKSTQHLHDDFLSVIS